LASHDHADRPGQAIEHHRADLGTGPRAAGAARRLVESAVRRWELPALLDVLLLVVSELVTNAVRHGQPPVHLTVTRTPRQLRLEIHDDSSTEPVRSTGDQPDLDAETGRGIDIVTALADDFGCEQVKDDGKIVYAAFSRPLLGE
jgi:anti-sigma regulatory factor (Ser/Thr protein kinase)